MLMLLMDKSLGQDVGSLLLCWGIFKTNLFTLNFLPQKVVTDFNVFGLIMELWVVRDGDCGLVIDVESGW